MQKHSLLWVYISAFSGSWFNAMSGVSGVLLTVVAAILPEHQSYFFWVVAVFCLIIAPYGVWKREYLRADKNSSPEAVAEFEMMVEAHKRSRPTADAFTTRK